MTKHGRLGRSIRRNMSRHGSAVTESLEARALLSTITVTSLGDTVEDDGVVTLREAIQAANTDTSVDGSVAGSGFDTIVFDPSLDGDVIQLADTIKITESVSIEGRGSESTRIRGRRSRDGFRVETAGVELSVSGVRMTQHASAIRQTGHTSEAGNSTTVRNSRFRFNRRAIVTGSALAVANTEFFQNGSGILSNRADSLSVRTSRFISNGGEDQSHPDLYKGAGIALWKVGHATVESSLFDGNTGTDGGAVFAWLSKLDVTNSTFTGNNAEVGGAIYSEYTELRIENSTVVDNHADGTAGGVFGQLYEGHLDPGAVSASNSVFASNTNGDFVLEDESETGFVSAHSFFGSNTGTTLEANGGAPDSDGNLVGSESSPLDPGLGSLQDNGGWTETMLPQADSPLIDAASGSLLQRDQRGTYPRRAGDGVDIGAAEAVDVVFSVTPSSPVIDEGDESLVRTFDITLETEVADAFDLTITTEDDSATAGTDYVAVDETLSFSGTVGQTRQFEVTVLDDADFEGIERFLLDYTSTLDGSTVGGTVHFVAIESDEASGVALEDSKLLIWGDETDNIVAIELDGDNVEVTLDDDVHSIPVSAFSSVEVRLRAGADSLTVGEGIDGPMLVSAGIGDDTVLTGGGNDTVFAGAGDDLVSTGGGDDFILGDAGDDTVLAGAGTDTVNGSSGSDSLNGEGGVDLLIGQGGRDWLSGGGGKDTLLGGASRDVLDGGPGDDRLEGYTDDDLGDDDSNPGPDGDDTLFGGSGRDEITDSIGMNAVFGGPDKDIIVAGGKLSGGLGDDRIRGTAAGSILRGGSGNDALTGSDGDDTLIGGQGRDRLTGEGGNDLLLGGRGVDTLIGDDAVNKKVGVDVLIGGGGSDTLRGQKAGDLMVAGSTSLNLAELSLVFAEWTSDRGFALRQANLTDGSGSAERNNADVFLVDSGEARNLFDDDRPDTLYGGGGNDWLIANSEQDDSIQ
ncbi:MAG: choice-of-anchor Q domain-containing protein [Planctomycetaceae bacterium]